MAWCLTAPSHGMYQCWLVIKNPLTFIWEHFLERCLHYESLKLAWQLLQNFHSGFPGANGLSITGPCQFLRFYLMSSSHLWLSVICHGFISHWGWLTGNLFFQSEPYLTGFTFPALSFASTLPFQAQQLWTPGWLDTSFCSCCNSEHRSSLNVMPEPFKFFLSAMTSHFTSQNLNFTTTGLVLFSVFLPNLWHISILSCLSFSWSLSLIIWFMRGISSSFRSSPKPTTNLFVLRAYWSFSMALALADWILSRSSWCAFSSSSTLLLKSSFSCRRSNTSVCNFSNSGVRSRKISYFSWESFLSRTCSIMVSSADKDICWFILGSGLSEWIGWDMTEVTL